MVALVQNAEGKVITVHRTYVFADGKREKKLYKVIPDRWLGGAIRLFPHAEKIGFVALAEGIETALAIYEMFAIPTWATVTADGMAQWEPPAFIKRVSIFADNDENFKGQSAAYLLANRLSAKGVIVEVHLPQERGDYLDLFNNFTLGVT
jgi:putative DNA primase/helicase